MAINETISKGNKYRRLKDAANKVWQRISFWTAASDVEFENGNTLQSTLGTVTGITDSLTSNSSTVAASAAAVYSLNSKITSFSGSLSNLYNAFVAKGVTPSAKTLDACVAAVNTLQATAYAAGYNAGYIACYDNIDDLTYARSNGNADSGGTTWTLAKAGKIKFVYNGVASGSDHNYCGIWCTISIGSAKYVDKSAGGSGQSSASFSGESDWITVAAGSVVTITAGSLCDKHSLTIRGQYVPSA